MTDGWLGRIFVCKEKEEYYMYNIDMNSCNAYITYTQRLYFFLHTLIVLCEPKLLSLCIYLQSSGKLLYLMGI